MPISAGSLHCRKNVWHALLTAVGDILILTNVDTYKKKIIRNAFTFIDKKNDLEAFDRGTQGKGISFGCQPEPCRTFFGVLYVGRQLEWPGFGVVALDEPPSPHQKGVLRAENLVPTIRTCSYLYPSVLCCTERTPIISKYNVYSSRMVMAIEPVNVSIFLLREASRGMSLVVTPPVFFVEVLGASPSPHQKSAVRAENLESKIRMSSYIYPTHFVHVSEESKHTGNVKNAKISYLSC